MFSGSNPLKLNHASASDLMICFTGRVGYEMKVELVGHHQDRLVLEN